MTRRIFSLILAVSTLCVPMLVYSDEPSVNVPQDLKDLAARLELEVKIAESRRKLLATTAGKDVTLPSGDIEKLQEAIVPSVARFVAYDALQRIGEAICADLGAGPYYVTAVKLNDLRDQRLSVLEQLEYLRERAELTADALEKQNMLKEGAVTGALLGLDAAGAIGKAIAGLAGFFKTERKIATVDSVVDDAAALLAVRSCKTKPILLDPTAVAMSPALLAVTDVISLRGIADRLRGLIRTKQQELDRGRVELAQLKVMAEAAKAKEKEKPKVDGEGGAGKAEGTKPANSQAKGAKAAEANAPDGAPAATPQEKQAAKEAELAALDAAVKSAATVMTTVDTALDRLYTIDATTGLSPLVVLARMGAAVDRMTALEAKYSKAPPVLTVKVQHASGYTQVSKAWWRNDRLDFAGGVAVTYQVASIDGEIVQANGFYLQTPWMRLKEDERQFDHDIKQWRLPVNND